MGLQDKWFWRLHNNKVLPGYPMPIAHFWKGLPSNIDAAYERDDGKFVFFKGRLNLESKGRSGVISSSLMFWVFNPLPFSPSLCPGDRYWVYSESTMDKGSPKSLRDLGTGLPKDKIDAALFYTPTGQTYFFRGTE